MKNLQSLFVISSFLLIFSSCEMGKSKNEKLILGNWKYSEYISPSEAKKMDPDFNTPGVSVEITFEGEQSFLVGGRYNHTMNMTMRIKAGGQDIPLSLLIQDAGKYEIHDNSLLTISEDPKVIPMDEMTKQIIESDPTAAAAFSPAKGSSEQVEIISITEKIMELEPSDMGGITITYKKK